MRSIILLLGAVTCALAASVQKDVGSHDLTLGIVEDTDWIVWNREVKKAGSWWPWSSVDTSFSFTLPQLPSTIVISAVRAMDRSPLGTGGYAKLTSGGVETDHVTIDFTSQKGKGLDFLVVVYGRYKS